MDRQNKNNYELFSVGGLDFLVIHIELDWPDYSVAWADKIIKANPNRRVILSTHAFLNASNARPTSAQFRSNGTSAEAVWQQIIKPNCNVFMVINGHYPGEGRRTDLNNCGQPVHQVLMDYQEPGQRRRRLAALFHVQAIGEQDLRVHLFADAQRRGGGLRDRRQQPVRPRLRHAGRAVFSHRHERERVIGHAHDGRRGRVSHPAPITNGT